MTLLANGVVLQGRYQIVSLLGQGGMGAVYLAEDTRLPGRLCAIKENLPDPGASPQALAQARQQFLAEASILARLDHPNLPKVSDYFTDAGREYLVMDYVEGQDLASALQQHGKPLPEKPVLIWMDQVLDALEYLHSRRPQPVIHRDIKPSNIRLTPEGKVKLVDFGLVKLLDPSDPRTKSVLRGLGTPEYAPLEQYASGAGHTDARSDLYSLGATMYHLLTNVAPPDVHQRLLTPAVLAPPRHLNPQLSLNTEQAALKAMEIQPGQRFQTAREMRQALKGAVPASAPPVAPPTVPTVAPHPGPGRPVSQAIPAGRVAVVAIVIVALFVILARGFFGGGPTVPTPTRVPAAAALPTTQPPTTAPAPPLPAKEVTTTPVLTAQPSTVTPAATLPADASAGETWTSPLDGMVMVYVPAGEFLMGSAESDAEADDDEKPQHTVYLDAFWIDRTEVTNGMFSRFVAATSYRTDAEKRGSSYAFDTARQSWEDMRGADWQHPRGPSTNLNGLDTHPVVRVSWNDAAAYCQWAGRRLPTEAEWEKAARGTDGRKYPWGNQTVAGDLLNFCDRNCSLDWKDSSIDDSYADTAPVGNYPAGASPYGALDMAGNVLEWVADRHDAEYYASSPARNPPGPSSGNDRVLRGGGWFNDQEFVRTANRTRLVPDGAYDGIGFRCAGLP